MANRVPYLTMRVRLPERPSPLTGSRASLARGRRRARRHAGATQRAKAFARKVPA